jgi:hypothetical protein
VALSDILPYAQTLAINLAKTEKISISVPCNRHKQMKDETLIPFPFGIYADSELVELLVRGETKTILHWA